MIIKAFNKYIVLCKGVDGNIYKWHLDVKPWNKAWKVINQNIQIGKTFKEYLILSIELEENLFNEETKKDPEDKKFTMPISKKEFDYAINYTSIDYAATPSYSQSYRCSICNGVVANDFCTRCMFDWGS